jgi:Uncharacterized protein containing double-stranded beta helix domain
VIGGVGVSGATGPDDGACADAGLRAAEDRQPKGGPTMATTETYPSEPNGMIPNSRYPLLIHRGGVPGGGEDAVRARFRANGWLNNWRYPGIYDYGHFHSTTHECLGVAIGWMELELFGEGGTRARLEAGDVVVMPAGVSHAMVGGSEDVLVVGGYPDGRDWDNIKDHLLDEPMRRAAAKRIMMLPIPAADPVTGKPMRGVARRPVFGGRRPQRLPRGARPALTFVGPAETAGLTHSTPPNGLAPRPISASGRLLKDLARDAKHSRACGTPQ